MIKAFQEITEWDSDFEVPNHVYFLNEDRDRMYGYVIAGTDVVHTMTSPYRFHTRGRKFKQVENRWNFSAVADEPQVATGQQYRVPGSKGAVYTVSNDLGVWSCTCPAAKWQRGACKHITQLKTK